MRVLIINKFLYPNGGSETYIFKLGEALEQHGHEVQYFGMEHEGRCVGNRVNAYTSDMDFHGGSKLSKLTYPIKTIYSKEARVQLRKVLDDFKPDVCHLNNFNYQLTPSIILEIVKWRKETGRDCKIIFTAHDYQLVCPNHMLNNPNTHQNCEKCLGGHFVNCMKGKCIHGSTAKSAIGMMEAEFWKWKGTYKYIDTMICCSEFMKSKMDSNPLFATKTVAMHNFIDKVEWKETEKKDYVLYFGRFSEEKGIGTLIKVCKELPDVQFIFAGTGPLEETVNGIKNIKNVGFQKGEALEKLIREARFSIYPSEWYENCPFSVMESQMYGTPVLGANIGGIPELIQVGKTGELFKSGDGDELKSKIQKLWGDKELCDEYSKNCKGISFDTINEYYEKIMKVYYHFAGWCSKRSWNVCVSALHKHGNLFNCNNNDYNYNGHQYDYEPTLYGTLFKVKVVHFLPDAIDQYYWLSYYDSFIQFRGEGNCTFDLGWIDRNSLHFIDFWPWNLLHLRVF